MTLIGVSLRVSRLEKASPVSGTTSGTAFRGDNLLRGATDEMMVET